MVRGWEGGERRVVGSMDGSSKSSSSASKPSKWESANTRDKWGVRKREKMEKRANKWNKEKGGFGFAIEDQQNTTPERERRRRRRRKRREEEVRI